MVNLHFRYAVANRFDVTWISHGQPFDPDLDASSCLKVTQAVEPLPEIFSLT